MNRPLPSGPMEAARFETLATAFGAGIDRWPASERDAERLFLRDNPAAAEALLERERDLDSVLAGWCTAPAPPFLDQAIATRVLSRVSTLRRLRTWFTGAAAAMSLAGGLAAGLVLATSVGDPAPEGPSLWGVSVLGATFDPAQDDRAAVGAGEDNGDAAQPTPGGS